MSATQPSNAATTPSSAVVTRGLRKSYGPRVALDGLDMNVPTGCVYGFLGPNGAGKTTTLRLLTGLMKPDAGTISMLGQPFERSDRRRLFQVGSLVEAPSFYPHLSARNNLRVIAAAGSPVSNQRVDELLDLVSLTNRANDAVSTYSMGMRQRLGIATALLNDPALLLLDEPANGLDPSGIVGLRDALRSLAAVGKTVVVSSHILPEVQQLADIVGIVSAGKIVAEGPLAELLASQGVVRVKIRPDEVERSLAVLGMLVDRSRIQVPYPDLAWILIRTDAGRAAEVNRALAQVGIFASALEAGSDLEELFLRLTAGPPGPSPTAQASGSMPAIGGVA